MLEHARQPVVRQMRNILKINCKLVWVIHKYFTDENDEGENIHFTFYKIYESKQFIIFM